MKIRKQYLNGFEPNCGLHIFSSRHCVYQAYKHTYFLVDVLWGQPIKLVQVASTSELHENQQKDLLFFEIVPCHFCGASEVET
jgi:hypothetical protein